jgi:8-oxo-dGTP pyrophosphatase MutT (NUDIX family)
MADPKLQEPRQMVTQPARVVQRYEVSLKAFLVHAGRAALVRESDTGLWELPGGRIDVGEEWLDHGAVLQREIAEELGGGVAFEAYGETVTWTRQRPTDGVFQFLVARPCRLIAGVPRLSDEHADLAWHTPDSWSRLLLPPLSGYAVALDRLWASAGL